MLVKDPPVEIADGLWMLGANAYPVYLLRGEKEAAMVEGGIGPIGLLVREQLQTLSVDPATVKTLILAHAHPDHVMAVPAFREMFPDVTVTASAAAAKTLKIDKAIAFFCKMDGALTDALIETGQMEEKYRPEPVEITEIAVDRSVKQGDRIELDGFAFEVLETPGHSDCSLSLYEPDRKILFISDATGYYMPKHECWWPNYFVDYGTYVDSMQRLAALDTEILCLGHHAAITGADAVQAYFRDVIAATESLHQEIVEEVGTGKTVREVAERLGTDVHEKLPLFPLDFYQKNCGLLVKASLRHEGIEV
ncbi:MAG: MBL fold metallo-hydrolase [Candidatus Nealsonbacteria bacterium]|nr:MBL fold metallo-hydrolase [Candidatus Nealsonbacteria bacterium]